MTEAEEEAEEKDDEEEERGRERAPGNESERLTSNGGGFLLGCLVATAEGLSEKGERQDDGKSAENGRSRLAFISRAT